MHPGSDPPAVHQRPHVNVQTDLETTTEALRAISISVPSTIPLSVRGTSVSLAIALDEHDTDHRASSVAIAGVERPDRGGAQPTSAYGRYREPIRRDSLKRREALLKGKEGSRRRQRWENDHLLSNPYAQPPLPSDWEVRPTYPRHATVKYNLASLWDEGGMGRKAAMVATARFQEKRKKQMNMATGSMLVAGASTSGTATETKIKVVKDLRHQMKKARAARGLLHDLEQEIRAFAEGWAAETTMQQRRQRHAQRPPATQQQRQHDEDDMVLVHDEEDRDSEEEIVFVGRKGQMSGRERPSSAGSDSPTVDQGRAEDEHRLKKDKLILDSPVDDRNAAFQRWLVHNVASYYGLQAWSVTVDGDPARREAYISAPLCRDNHPQQHQRQQQQCSMISLPRPLWVLI